MPKDNETISLADLLLKWGGIKQEDLNRAQIEAAQNNSALEDVLINKGVLTEEKLADVLSNYFQVPYLNLTNELFDQKRMSLLPEIVMRTYEVVPIEIDDQEIKVAMANPSDLHALDYIELISDRKPKPQVATRQQVQKTISNYFSSQDEVSKLPEINLEKPENVQVVNAPTGLKEGSVAELIDPILAAAVRIRASDIHIEPQHDTVLVRFRIDGRLKTESFISQSLHPSVVSRIKILCHMNITERRMPQDGKFTQMVLNRPIDFRVSTLPAQHGEKIVMRILDKGNFILSVNNLGLTPEVQTQLEEIITRPSGLFLVTGPTGSGKTTTLYSVLNRIKSPDKNILSLEDPVEYELLSGTKREGGITQVQVNDKIGYTFARALRSCLRQDPDVILVGEIRDKETVEVATTAALTGHLVLSSLHTNTAISTINRLTDMGVEPYLVVASLIGVLAQRLVRVLCSDCKESYRPSAGLVERLNLRFPDPTNPVLYRPKGCPKCYGSGYLGRTAIYELLVITNNIRTLILNGAKDVQIAEEIKKTGASTMKDNGLHLVAKGLTTMAEILKVAP